MNRSNSVLEPSLSWRTWVLKTLKHIWKDCVPPFWLLPSVLLNDPYQFVVYLVVIVSHLEMRLTEQEYWEKQQRFVFRRWQCQQWHVLVSVNREFVRVCARLHACIISDQNGHMCPIWAANEKKYYAWVLFDCMFLCHSPHQYIVFNIFPWMAEKYGRLLSLIFRKASRHKAPDCAISIVLAMLHLIKLNTICEYSKAEKEEQTDRHSNQKNSWLGYPVFSAVLWYCFCVLMTFILILCLCKSSLSSVGCLCCEATIDDMHTEASKSSSL